MIISPRFALSAASLPYLLPRRRPAAGDHPRRQRALARLARDHDRGREGLLPGGRNPGRADGPRHLQRLARPGRAEPPADGRGRNVGGLFQRGAEGPAGHRRADGSARRSAMGGGAQPTSKTRSRPSPTSRAAPSPPIRAAQSPTTRSARALKTVGLALRDVDVKYLPFGQVAVAFANKAVDAGFSLPPFASQVVDRGLARGRRPSTTHHAEPMIIAVYFINSDWAGKNEALVKRYSSPICAACAIIVRPITAARTAPRRSSRDPHRHQAEARDAQQVSLAGK